MVCFVMVLCVDCSCVNAVLLLFLFLPRFFLGSGEGKCRELDTKCTVFKRAPDQKYNLKMKTAREVSSQDAVCVSRRLGVLKC